MRLREPMAELQCAQPLHGQSSLRGRATGKAPLGDDGWESSYGTERECTFQAVGTGCVMAGRSETAPRFRNEEHVWGSTGMDQMGVLEDLTFITGHSASRRPCREECAPIPVKWEV